MKLVLLIRPNPEEEEAVGSRWCWKHPPYVLSLSGTGFMSVRGGGRCAVRAEMFGNPECNDCELFTRFS
ncbi:hypothetical protein [Alternaria alternata fusarivirus 1]|nr:hypothetical protein [Alternaria alternata fusarivirus 1]